MSVVIRSMVGALGLWCWTVGVWRWCLVGCFGQRLCLVVYLPNHFVHDRLAFWMGRYVVCTCWVHRFPRFWTWIFFLFLNYLRQAGLLPKINHGFPCILVSSVYQRVRHARSDMALTDTWEGKGDVRMLSVNQVGR